jgi:hypothetical protein
MSTRAALNHIAKVVLQQKVAPVAIDQSQPNFMFDAQSALPAFGDLQISVIAFEGHLADLKLLEWREALAELLRDAGADLADTSDLQLEPLS